MGQSLHLMTMFLMSLPGWSESAVFERAETERWKVQHHALASFSSDHVNNQLHGSVNCRSYPTVLDTNRFFSLL